ncbi:AraC family transcriptional regulator [Paenibacillus sp. EC2-1]|uniref:AraC family transcriptional regulator n=1 Tax=Paenibacillus sp. EC2-1 TaxID=3388665 RepID=UPI003BEEDE89
MKAYPSEFPYSTLSHSPSDIAVKFMFFVQDVGWYVCKPDYCINRSLSHYQLKYVVKGSGYVTAQGRTYKVNAGELFFLDLSQMHQYNADPSNPWELLWVRFGGIQSSYYFELLHASECPVFQISNTEQTELLFKQLYDLFLHRPIGLEFIASSLITQVFTQLIMSSMDKNNAESISLKIAYPTEIQLALEFIEAHYPSDIKVEDVAHFIHLSPYYFSRLFKRYTCHTVTEYIIKYRLIISKQLLTSTMMSIGQIAQHVGIGSQSYFSMLFKKYEGITPKEYRQYIHNDKV